MSGPSCSRCQGKVVYTRRYSGESLCTSCFRKSIVDKTRRTISRFDMLHHGDKVGVAVSGGKDSLSLLSVLHEISKTKRCTLVALTVDEGVAGYREESLGHAATLASELSVESVVVSYKELYGFTLDEALDWKDEREVSSCSICGVFRRRAIDEAAVRAGVNVIATAHNLDDYVQTFMMNLMHGDTERLGWLDPALVDDDFPLRRVKPFIETYEEEIALFAHLTGLPFQGASCPYMHEALRSEVRDFLNEMEAKHPGMKNVIFKSSISIASKLASLKGAGAIPCSLCGKPSSKGTCGVCTMKKLVADHARSPSALAGTRSRSVRRG